MSSIFGGSKQSSQNTQQSNSSNQAYGDIKNLFSGVAGGAQSGMTSLQQLLGGDSTGFDAYKNATGFDAMAKAGGQGITGGAAAKGLLRSGSTGKALQSYGTGLQNQFAGSYMDKLLQQIGAGQSAGNTIAGAGQVSNSTGTSTSSSKSKPGIGGLVGSIMTGGVM